MTLGIAVVTNPTEVEFVADLLWGLGVSALSEDWGSDGTVTLRTSLGENRASVVEAIDSLPVKVHWRFEDIDDAIGNEWRSHVAPVPVTADLEIVPAWIDVETPSVGTRILIEPGSTFGLGDHPTTRACLSILAEIGVEGRKVLDVGCGSGVLGITALVLGASQAIGVDITPAAVEVSQANARRNGVEERWFATTDELATIRTDFDIVVANILAPTLIDLSGELARLLKPGGILVISGVLDGRYQHVLEALEPLRLVESRVIDGWAAVVLS